MAVWYTHPQNCLKFKMAPRDSFVAMVYLDGCIPVNSPTFANDETWFELTGAELLVEPSIKMQIDEV